MSKRAGRVRPRRGSIRYLRDLFFTIVIFSVLSFAFNAAVDPYYVFGSPRVAWFNLSKPAALERGAAAKTYLLERVHPRTLLLGNSRVEIGLDPSSTVWPPDFRPVFNAALAGRGPEMAASLLADAVAEPGLRHVVIGLDYLDFLQFPRNSAACPAKPEPDQQRMQLLPDLSANSASWWARLKDRLSATLTVDALRDSIRTVLFQGDKTTDTLTPLGFHDLREYAAFARRHGFRLLFDDKQAQYAARFKAYPHPDFSMPYRIDGFCAFREIILIAQATHLDVVFIIYPYHAWALDLIRRYGLWTGFGAWKRALVRVADKLDPSHRVRIVDFSGYNAYTTEAVPALGDTSTRLQWYWEPGHFQPALGDRVIETLYGRQPPRIPFGRPLNTTTIESAIQAIDEEARKHALIQDASNPG